APTLLARVHVDGDDAAEWRFEQRQPAWSRKVFRQADEIIGALPRFRLANGDGDRQAERRHVERVRVGIDRSTGPARAARIAGYLDGAALRRRGEQAAAVIGIGDGDRLLMNLRRQIDEIVVGRALDVEWRRL